MYDKTDLKPKEILKEAYKKVVKSSNTILFIIRTNKTATPFVQFYDF